MFTKHQILAFASVVLIGASVSTASFAESENNTGSDEIVTKTYDKGRDRPVYNGQTPVSGSPVSAQENTPAENVPEPASIALVGLGIAGFFLARRRMKSDV